MPRIINPPFALSRRKAPYRRALRYALRATQGERFSYSGQRGIFSQTGYILFATLIFLFIFSLLTTTSLSTLQLNLKIKEAALQRAETLFISKQLLAQLTLNQQCIIPLTLPQSLTEQSLLWWWQHGCRLSSENFYVIESLGVDHCAMIENAAAVADYYRFTLYTPSQNSVSNPVILQTTIIQPASITHACNTKQHVVHPGQQMWREL